MAHQVHDVGVALEGHEGGRLHASDPGDAPDVVPSQVDQHHVLRPVLLARQKLPAQRLVLLRIAAPGTGARDGAKRDPVPAHPDQDLGRGARHGPLAEPEIEHVGRRVQHAERPVDVERSDRDGRLEAVREHDLDDVPRPDVPLGAKDSALVSLLSHAAYELYLAVQMRRWGSRGERRAKARHHFVDRCDRLPVRPVGVLLGAAPDDESEAVPEVVEHQDDVGEDKVEVGVAQVVIQPGRKLL